MTYYRVDSRMWDDELFVEANDLDRSIWQLLLTGPQRSALPGLQRGGMATLAETLRRPVRLVTEGFNWWVERGRAVFNVSVRVIWVPNAPEYNEAESPNQIRAWWNRWREIPECAAKYQHIANLNAFAGLEKPSHVQAWDVTFGTVDQSVADRFKDTSETLQQGLPGIAPLPRVGSSARGRASSDSDSYRSSDSDRGGGARHGSALPEGWAPTEKDVEHAKGKGWDDSRIAEEAERFRAHHLAKGTLSKAWNQSWITWVANDKRFNGPAGGGRPGPSRSTQPPAATQFKPAQVLR